MKYTFYDVDERIAKTKYALSDAIVNLIKQENKIKVLDICREANISPMTYYHHFNNKTDLLKYTVKKQLENILPIPKKLKPISIKHLMFYMINNLGRFIIENQQLIYSSIQQNKKHGYSNSYIHLFFLNVSYFLKQELTTLCSGNPLDVEIWNNIMCGILFNIFIQMLIKNNIYNTRQIWTSFKSFTTLLI